MPAKPVRRRTLYLALAVIAALGIAAVLYTALSTSDEPTGGANAGAAEVFTARTLAGEQVTVPGGRPSVLFFFSVGCGECVDGARALAEAQRAVGERASFVAVDIDPTETEQLVHEFLTGTQTTTLAYALDPDARWLRAFGVTRLSTAVVLDSSGREVFRGVDPPAADLQAQLAAVTSR